MKINLDYERYVLAHSSAFKAIFDESINDTEDSNVLDGFVKISYNGHSIYRKLIGRSVDGDYIQMGYRTQRELQVKENEDVQITPANWFCYYWCNSENYIKHIFQIAVIGFVIAIVSLFK